MPEALPPLLSNALIGAVALLILMIAWRATSGGTTGQTILARAVLFVLLLPFILAAVLASLDDLGIDTSGFGGRPGDRPTAVHPPGETGPKQVGAGKSGPTIASKPAPPPPPVPETTSVPPPQARPEPPTPPPPPPRQEEAAVPDAARPGQEPPTTTAPPTGPGEPPAADAPPPPAPTPTTTPAPPPAAEPWDVVPVYYGTDRNNARTPDQPEYGSERARRLELGRALVTVPKTHEVPNIERPWVYRLPFTRIVLYREREDPSQHFTLKEIRAVGRDELGKLVRDRLAASREFKDQALVFVHGFNTTFENAVFRTAQIAYDLQFDGAPFVYSWPSKGQLGLQDYSYDRESSGQSVPYLKEFLDFVARETGARSVSIIAHSMGNQVLLPVLRDFRLTAPADVAIAQVILAAPDVDRDNFEYLAREIAGVGKGVTMLAASNDRALDASRRFWGGVPRAGDVPAEGPVVVAGIDTIDVSAISTDILSLNHSGYAQKQELLADMRALLKSGVRPPEKRLPTLLKVTTPKGEYWRYPDAPQ